MSTVALNRAGGHTRTSTMPITSKPLNIDRVNLHDREEREAFFNAWIDQGTAEVVEQRTEAYRAGLIDEHGHVVNRDAQAEVDERLTVEQ